MDNATTDTNDWLQYDQMKQKKGANPQYMDLGTRWEQNYLADVMHKQHLGLLVDDIKMAIISYVRLNQAPHLREHAIKWVLRRLEM